MGIQTYCNCGSAHPPDANAKEVLHKLYKAISEAQARHPDRFYIIAGYFNYTNLPSTCTKNQSELGQRELVESPARLLRIHKLERLQRSDDHWPVHGHLQVSKTVMTLAN